MSKPKQIHLPRSWWRKSASQQAEVDLQLVDIEDEMQHFERLEQRRLAEERREARKQAAEAARKRRKREQAAKRRTEAAEAKPKEATTSHNRRQQATTDNRKPASNLQELPLTRDAIRQWVERSEWFQQAQQDEQEERERRRRWHLMRRGDPEQLLAIRRGLELAANGERIPFRNFLRRAGFNYGAHCIGRTDSGSPKAWIICVETGQWHPGEQMKWTMQVRRNPDSGEVMLSGRRECYWIECEDSVSKHWGQLLAQQSENLIYQSLLSVIATADGSLLQFGQAFRAGWIETMMKEGVDKLHD